MAKQLPSINLLASHKKKNLDVFLDWVLSYGRIIVIITEIIALSALLYRFALDQQLIDLHSTIKDKQFAVESAKNDELIYRNLITKLALAKSLNNTSSTVVALLEKMVSLGTDKMEFDSLTVAKDKISVNATTKSAALLTNFINEFKRQPEIQSLSIDSIQNKTANGLIVVRITATLLQRGV